MTLHSFMIETLQDFSVDFSVAVLLHYFSPWFLHYQFSREDVQSTRFRTYTIKMAFMLQNIIQKRYDPKMNFIGSYKNALEINTMFTSSISISVKLCYALGGRNDLLKIVELPSHEHSQTANEQPLFQGVYHEKSTNMYLSLPHVQRQRNLQLEQDRTLCYKIACPHFQRYVAIIKKYSLKNCLVYELEDAVGQKFWIKSTEVLRKTNFLLWVMVTKWAPLISVNLTRLF